MVLYLEYDILNITRKVLSNYGLASIANYDADIVNHIFCWIHHIAIYIPNLQEIASNIGSLKFSMTRRMILKKGFIHIAYLVSNSILGVQY